MTDAIANGLFYAAFLGPMPVALYGLFKGRRQLYRGAYAVCWLLNYFASALQHDGLGQVVDALFFALWAYQWWNGGGGDSTRRRLKKWARKFTPVRRTAPQLT